ncbi:MAG: response regulator [Eubacteriales bacterium]|nr:response regulator [Eubacteriales bacterium]
MDERIRNPESRSSGRLALLMLLLLAVVVAVSVVSFQQMKESLYRERGNNLNQVMEKIGQNVEIVMQNRWDDVGFLAGMAEDEDYESMDDVQRMLQRMEHHLEIGNTHVFFVDRSGLCHTSEGNTFKWDNLKMLAQGSQKQKAYVAAAPAYGESEEHLFFMKRLPQEIVVGDLVLTHICLVSQMSSFDSFFDTQQYGAESVTFIIHQNGTQVYRQSKENSLTDIYNVISTLRQAEYAYDGSAEQMVEDLEAQRGNSACVNYKGRNYFVAYCPLDINDWTAVMMIPEEYVGTGTAQFMRSTIVAIVVVAAAVTGTFLFLLVLFNRMMRRKQEEINLQLRRAVEAERNANDAKTRFLSSMSHDIRTPMNAIIGMTAIAARHLDDANYVKECLSKVTLAGNHLLMLINDILDISKIESGRMTLNPVTFSLADTAMKLVNIVRPQINAKRQQFDIHIRRIQYEYLFADELRLNQIFINLLTNAVKYTPEGGRVQVDLEERVVTENPGLVTLIFSVTDSGIGMSEEFQKTMYESFSRATDSRIDRIQGSGLGLAICHQMVELMGGTITCESALGKGTKFTVTVEVPVAEKMMDDLILPPMKLLLVDDDRMFLSSTAEMMAEMGIHADCEDNGAAAVARVTEHHRSGQDYPVVILDWKMPDMSGIETAKAIRAQVGNQVPIIVISAYDWTELEEEAREAGINGFISKPLFKSTVYYKMKELMQPEEESLKPEEEDGSDLRGIRVLVAEDNDLNWEIMEAMLEMYEIKAVRAENGRQCVDMLCEAEEGAYAMVLMDIQMPVLNGREATCEIRKSERLWVRQIPVIAMTADAFAEDIQACMEAGMDSHVPKPVDMKRLIEEMEKAYRKNR